MAFTTTLFPFLELILASSLFGILFHRNPCIEVMTCMGEVVSNHQELEVTLTILVSRWKTVLLPFLASQSLKPWQSFLTWPGLWQKKHLTKFNLLFLKLLDPLEVESPKKKKRSFCSRELRFEFLLELRLINEVNYNTLPFLNPFFLLNTYRNQLIQASLLFLCVMITLQLTILLGQFKSKWTRKA